MVTVIPFSMAYTILKGNPAGIIEPMVQALDRLLSRSPMAHYRGSRSRNGTLLYNECPCPYRRFYCSHVEDFLKAAPSQLPRAPSCRRWRKRPKTTNRCRQLSPRLPRVERKPSPSRLKSAPLVRKKLGG